MKILLWEMRTAKGFTLMQLAAKSGIGKSISTTSKTESNIRYLERKKREIDEGRAHLAENDLIEADD